MTLYSAKDVGEGIIAVQRVLGYQAHVKGYVRKNNIQVQTYFFLKKKKTSGQVADGRDA